MNRRYGRNKRKINLKETINSYIQNNIREYIIVSIIFLIGIIIGVIFINNTSKNQSDEIINYISSFTSELKNNKEINTILLLKDSIKKNLILAVFLWFMGSTVIGISIVYLIVCFRGFCFGYTVASIILSLGIGKGLLFLISSLLLQSIIFIPCILSLAVSCMNLHKSIIHDRRKENIKIEILKHTIFSLFIFVMLIIASLVETYVSKTILMLLVKYI